MTAFTMLGAMCVIIYADRIIKKQLLVRTIAIIGICIAIGVGYLEETFDK